ncbi:MAG: hypothetical protein QG650_912 [Patescibacteria group bacterium]|nr:hypothetical protein [Patescibacteria group bacterium]
MEIPYGQFRPLNGIRLPVVGLGIELLYAGSGTDADFVSLANRAFVADFYRVEPHGFHRFLTSAAIEYDVAAFGVEVLPLLAE